MAKASKIQKIVGQVVATCAAGFVIGVFAAVFYGLYLGAQYLMSPSDSQQMYSKVNQACMMDRDQKLAFAMQANLGGEKRSNVIDMAYVQHCHDLAKNATR